MTLKDNQPILKELVFDMFDSFKPISEYTTEEKVHGRIETRTCSILDIWQPEKEGMYEE